MVDSWDLIFNEVELAWWLSGQDAYGAAMMKGVSASCTETASFSEVRSTASGVATPPVILL